MPVDYSRTVHPNAADAGWSMASGIRHLVNAATVITTALDDKLSVSSGVERPRTEYLAFIGDLQGCSENGVFQAPAVPGSHADMVLRPGCTTDELIARRDDYTNARATLWLARTLGYPSFNRMVASSRSLGANLENIAQAGAELKPGQCASYLLEDGEEVVHYAALVVAKDHDGRQYTMVFDDAPGTCAPGLHELYENLPGCVCFPGRQKTTDPLCAQFAIQTLLMAQNSCFVERSIDAIKDWRAKSPATGDSIDPAFLKACNEFYVTKQGLRDIPVDAKRAELPPPLSVPFIWTVKNGRNDTLKTQSQVLVRCSAALEQELERLKRCQARGDARAVKDCEATIDRRVREALDAWRQLGINPPLHPAQLVRGEGSNPT